MTVDVGSLFVEALSDKNRNEFDLFSSRFRFQAEFKISFISKVLMLPVCRINIVISFYFILYTSINMCFNLLMNVIACLKIWQFVSRYSPYIIKNRHIFIILVITFNWVKF